MGKPMDEQRDAFANDLPRLQKSKPAVTQKKLWFQFIPLSGVIGLLLSSPAFASFPQAIATPIAQQPTHSEATQPVFLELGKPIQRELKGNDNHQYQIALQAGQYLHLVVEQQGIDVSVTLFDPNGQQISVSDSPNDTQGPEPVSVIAEISGNYRIEVRQLSESHPNSGRYEAIVKNLQVATEQHRKLVAAERAFMEATQLQLEPTEPSMRQAIAKWQEALPIYQAAGDRKTEAFILTLIGNTYQDLQEFSRSIGSYEKAVQAYRAEGNKTEEATILNKIGLSYFYQRDNQKALDYYRQSLALYRAITHKLGEANTLFNLGAVYQVLEEKEKAIDFYHQSLSIYREGNYPLQEAHTLAQIAHSYFIGGKIEESLSYYDQLISLYQKASNKLGEASTLFKIGLVSQNLEDKSRSIESYIRAIAIYQEANRKGQAAHVMLHIAYLYSDSREKDKALEYYHKALSLYRDLGEKAQEVATLTKIAVFYSKLQENQTALELHNQTLSLYRDLGDKDSEAIAFNNIGVIYSSLGEMQKALDSYKQALSLRRLAENEREEAATFNNIGFAYYSLGELEKALEYYNQALPLLQKVGDRLGEATTLHNIGLVYNLLGEKQKALDFYNQALTLRRMMEDKEGEAHTLTGIGAVYHFLGDRQKALDFYNQALPLRRAVGDRTGEAVTLNNVGAVYDRLGEMQKALEFYNQALPIRRAVGDRPGEAGTLHNIGTIYNSLGERQKALEYYKQSLLLSQAVGNREGEASTLNSLGKVYALLEDNRKAVEYYNQALSLRKAVGDREGEANTLYNLADTERKIGNLNSALTKIETAIAIVEDLRTKIGSQELRSSYFATVQDYYHFYIDLLMQLHQQNPSQGYDAKALHVSERARARSLLELLAEASTNIREGVDPKLLEQERKLQYQLNAFEYRKYELQKGQYNQTEISEIQQKIDTIFIELKQVESQIRTNSPRYADLKYPEPLNLQQIQQQVLDDDTLLLEYALGSERSYLWAVTKNSISSYQLPKQSEIETAVQAFRESVTKESNTNLNPGLLLSQILLAPVASQLSNKRLLIVGDGVLQSVPFAALPLPASPTTPLLVQNEIVTLPSISTIAIQRRQLQNRPMAEKTLAVIADPVFELNDDRVAKTSPNMTASINPDSINYSAQVRAARNLGIGQGGKLFSRLPFTRTEANKILALVPEGQRLQALDFAADRSTVTKPELAQYQILHLATHGLLDPVNPELSGIVLSLYDRLGNSQDGFLRLQDIFNLNLPAELVVLSACQTGLGENVKGEGLVGLTRGFMYAGARRVIVSLWSVSDVATSELMAKFYQKMLQEKQNPITALREAQLEMWKSSNWQSPYYWAAFTVQGDWR